jgi:uncharacterized membrane protein
MSGTLAIIVAGAVATYAARTGGHLVLSRFARIPPRVLAALDAVPAAVLTAIVAPALLKGGPVELAALAAAALASTRLGALTSFVIGAAVLMIGRQVF